jgi:hypothetical protein
MVGVTGEITNTGFATTVTVPVCVVLLQFKLVPTTLYTLVCAGEAITDEPFGELNVVAGDQVKLSAPLADNTALLPKHMLGDETLIIGLGKIAMLNVATLVQVLAVPITVPDPITEGGIAVALTFAPDNVFGARPVKPTQLYDVAPLAVTFTALFEPL